MKVANVLKVKNKFLLYLFLRHGFRLIFMHLMYNRALLKNVKLNLFVKNVENNLI